MSTPVTFADPERRLLDLVKAALALPDLPACLLDADADPATASTSYPDGGTGAPSAPHFQVRHDGTPSPGVHVETSTIGLTAWYPPNRRTDAKDAIAWVSARLAAHGWGIRAASGRLPGVDRDTGLYFVGTEWRVRLKGQALT